MDTSRFLDNRTLLVTRCTPMDDARGREVLLVVAKLTWAVDADGRATIAVPQAPVRFTPVTRSEAQMAGPMYPSDLCPEKPGTDILLVGSAQPPTDGEATEQVVSLRVETGSATIQKAVRVYGQRVWVKGALGVVPGPAAALEPTPLCYELAYGGHDLSNAKKPLVEDRNPVGMGVLRDRSALVGQPAPQIEDPLAPLSSRKPAPAGLGPIAPSWAPRAELCGTLDAEWRRTRAPIWPRDFDPRFYCCAPPDQWSETPLVGDEPVEVVGATPAGRWAFQLPHHEPVFTSKLRGQAERECETHLDTYLIDAGEGRVELTWRVAVPLPRKTEHLERVDLYGLGELPEDVIDDLRQRVMPRAELEAS